MAKKFSDGKIVFESDSATAVLLGKDQHCEFLKLVINPQSKIPKHSMDITVNFFLISGRGILYINGQKIDLQSGDLISLAPGEEREWENATDNPIEILVIKELQ